MDARFSSTHRPLKLGFLLLSLTLAGCASTSRAPVVHPGLAVFNEAIALPATTDSIVREGDEVTYLVRTENPPLLVRFDTSCTQATGSMFYPSRHGMAAFADKPRASDALPEQQLQQLQHSPQLQQVCAQRTRPDWRVLELADDQDWLMLDRNSLHREGELLYAWSGKHYLHYQVGSDHVSLQAQSRERLALDCAQRAIRRLSQFMLDADARVHSGKLEPGSAVQPLKEAPVYQQRLFDAACQPEAELARLPALKPRTPLPPPLGTPVAAPEVVAAIEALALPEPRLSLHRLDYRYDVLIPNMIKANDIPRQVFIGIDSDSGQLLLQPLDSTLPPEIRLTFRGLFNLAQLAMEKKTGQEKGDSWRLAGLSFQGDWRTLPANSQVGYTLTQVKAGPSEAISKDSTVTCRVGPEHPASIVHPALEGMAKPLTCIKFKSRTAEWSERYRYLTEYGLFVQDSENSPLGRWSWRIESVE